MIFHNRWQLIGLARCEVEALQSFNRKFYCNNIKQSSRYLQELPLFQLSAFLQKYTLYCKNYEIIVLQNSFDTNYYDYCCNHIFGYVIKKKI